MEAGCEVQYHLWNQTDLTVNFNSVFLTLFTLNKLDNLF